MMAYVRTILMSVVMLGLAACGTLQGVQQSPAADFPFRHNAFDLKVAWKTSRFDKGLAIDGILKNVRYQQINDVEVTVSVIDKDNRVLGSDRTLVLPYPINMGDYVPFDLTVRNVVPERGDEFQFLIKYRAYDGGPGTFTWLSRFRTDALTGAAIVDKAETSGRW